MPRICYGSMRHSAEGDVVSPRDCVVLASGNRKKDLPFIAKVTHLWENPMDGEMAILSHPQFDFFFFLVVVVVCVWRKK